MFSRATVAVCVLTCLFAAAVAATPAATETSTEPGQSSEKMEEPLVGDHWTYEVYDDITGTLKFTNTTIVTDVTPAEIALRIEWPGKSGIVYVVYDHSWNVKTNQAWKFSPNDGMGFKAPLQVGESWSFRGSDLDSTHGVSFKRSGSSKVVAAESVTTSAGTFDTFKVETSVTFRNAADPTKKSEAVRTAWFAPSINHWVKLTEKMMTNGHIGQGTSFLLVEFGTR
jgi:hypothetical protein